MSDTVTTKKETTAGNYFVSNYPPFSCWNPQQVPQALAALETPRYEEVTVTVTGVDDALVDGDITFNLTLDPSGADYGAVASATVPVTTTDDDSAGFAVVPISGLITTEAGGTAMFTVALNSQPTADVTVGLSSSNTAEGTVSQASLTFTSVTWNTPQTVTVSAIDDTVGEGSHSGVIQHLVRSISRLGQRICLSVASPPFVQIRQRQDM